MYQPSASSGAARRRWASALIASVMSSPEAPACGSADRAAAALAASAAARGLPSCP
ncbi:hypothetical protein LMG1860_06252 [Achromobacter denitrificans]|nr:hypothetical protein LMG1860_06252 [Achromobacter denitrificans]